MENKQPPFYLELLERDLKNIPEILSLYEPERVQAYYEFLVEQNEPGGFFSKNDSDRILERHLFESLVFGYYVTSKLNVSRETKIADAGSGPGLPGFLFACLKEPPALTLFDSSKRRLGLLEKFVAENSLFASGRKRIRFRYERLEEARGKFDLVVLRALIPFPFSVEIISGLQTGAGQIAINGTLDFKKISHREKEYLKRLGYVSRETIRPSELTFLGERTINILLKTGPAVKGYPRNWKQIKEEMKRWEK